MSSASDRRWKRNLVLVIALLVGLGAGQVWAEEPTMKDGGTEPGKVYLGMRAGFAPSPWRCTACDRRGLRACSRRSPTSSPSSN